MPTVVARKWLPKGLWRNAGTGYPGRIQLISSLLAGQQEWFILLYPLVSLFAALASALVGFGGGIIMLVLLSPFTELKVLVALVAMVQLASLVFRFYIYRQGIDYRLTGLYLLGSFPGIVLAAWLFEAVNSQQLGIVLGIYLMYSAWRPDGLPLANSRLGIPLSASVMAFVSFFVGAPGPAIASLMSQLNLAKIAFLGTLSACLLGQTLMRLGAFFRRCSA